eukprot:gene6083-7580_t
MDNICPELTIESNRNHPLSSISYTRDDLRYMKIMFQFLLKMLEITDSNPLGGGDRSSEFFRPSYTSNLNGEEKLRCIINNFEKALQLKELYCVGFFGTRSNDDSVKKEIIESDDLLVSTLPEFKGIVAYVTIQKEHPTDPDQLDHLPNKKTLNYGNIVVLESLDVIKDWTGHSSHRAAVQDLSPLYYHMVRIHNAHITIPPFVSQANSFGEYLRNLPPLNKCQVNLNISIIRTKYYGFQSGSVSWRAMRTYTNQLQLGGQREIVFTSFLSLSNFRFFKAVAESIGNEFGVPIKMVNIYELVSEEHWKRSPYQLMKENGVDFAFMCGLDYVKNESTLTPIVAPVRVEERYQNQSIYFSDIITHRDNQQINTLEDCRSATFIYNEENSYSGYHLLKQHIKDTQSTNISDYFGSLQESGSHSKSIEQIANSSGQQLCSSIDSTVLDSLRISDPTKLETIKIIKSLGPSTIPPLVSITGYDTQFLSKVKEYLSSERFIQSNKSILSEFGYKRFEKLSRLNFNDLFQFCNK